MKFVQWWKSRTGNGDGVERELEEQRSTLLALSPTERTTAEDMVRAMWIARFHELTTSGRVSVEQLTKIAEEINETSKPFGVSQKVTHRGKGNIYMSGRDQNFNNR